MGGKKKTKAIGYRYLVLSFERGTPLEQILSGPGGIVGIFETKEMAESHIMSVPIKRKEYAIRRIVWGERVRSL